MRKLLLAVPFALLMLKTSTASAMGASAAVLVGNGFEDVYKLGVGARGGFTLPMGFYIGGTFVYHFGTTEGGASANLFYFGPEAGYDINAGPVTVLDPTSASADPECASRPSTLAPIRSAPAFRSAMGGSPRGRA